MKREEMIKIRWKPYMMIDYKEPRMQIPVECMLSAIDWDAEILTLTPIHNFFERDEFQANLKFCTIPKRLKAATINGNKVSGTYENIIKSKKFEP